MIELPCWHTPENHFGTSHADVNREHYSLTVMIYVTYRCLRS